MSCCSGLRYPDPATAARTPARAYVVGCSTCGGYHLSARPLVAHPNVIVGPTLGVTTPPDQPGTGAAPGALLSQLLDLPGAA